MRLLAFELLPRSQYYNAIAQQTPVAWWLIGILHYRESDFRECHLHNGDPLTDRTFHESPNRPEAPPTNGIAYTI